MIERRRFLLGLMTAPAIVRASTLMPVRGWRHGWFLSGDGVALTSMPHPDTLADAMAGDFDTENLRYTCTERLAMRHIQWDWTKFGSTEQVEIEIKPAGRRLLPRLFGSAGL